MKRISSILSEDSCFGEKSRKSERAIQPIGVDSNIVDNVEEMTRFKVSCIKLKKKNTEPATRRREGEEHMIRRTSRQLFTDGRAVDIRTTSRRWGMVLAEGDLLNSHIFHPIGIGLQLVDIQHKDITLNLFRVSMCTILKIRQGNSRPSGRNSV